MGMNSHSGIFHVGSARNWRRRRHFSMTFGTVSHRRQKSTLYPSKCPGTFIRPIQHEKKETENFFLVFVFVLDLLLCFQLGRSRLHESVEWNRLNRRPACIRFGEGLNYSLDSDTLLPPSIIAPRRKKMTVQHRNHSLRISTTAEGDKPLEMAVYDHQNNNRAGKKAYSLRTFRGEVTRRDLLSIITSIARQAKKRRRKRTSFLFADFGDAQSKNRLELGEWVKKEGVKGSSRSPSSSSLLNTGAVPYSGKKVLARENPRGVRWGERMEWREMIPDFRRRSDGGMKQLQLQLQLQYGVNSGNVNYASEVREGGERGNNAKAKALEIIQGRAL